MNDAMFMRWGQKSVFFQGIYFSELKIDLFRVDAVFLDHLSQDIKGTNSSAVWRSVQLSLVHFIRSVFSLLFVMFISFYKLKTRCVFITIPNKSSEYKKS